MIKSEKGASLIDIVMSILILSMFVGFIGTLFYQIALNSNLIKYNALATHYAVKVAEKIDEIGYEDVTNNLNTTLIPSFDFDDQFDVTVTVRNYNQDDNTKKDILKIVTIQVDYSFININGTYEIEKLKVKEY